jgi:hypothetical protein
MRLADVATVVSAIFLVCIPTTVVLANINDPCLKAGRMIALLIPNPVAARRLVSQLAQERKHARRRGYEAGYCRALVENLQDKLGSQSRGVTFTPEIITASALQFEHFRLRTYISAGVIPKRYFGFFDEQGDSADFEKVLRETISNAVPLINNYAQKAGAHTRISEKEIAVTFLAEGGALLLTTYLSTAHRVHPVRHAGLDDFRVGFARYPTLVKQFDQSFGTRLGLILLPIPGRDILIRPMTFREAILTTALMYFYEKELLDEQLLKGGRVGLMLRPLEDQFIATSLMHNSGIVFSEERIAAIKSFRTGSYLAGVSEQSTPRYPRLPVESRRLATRRLRRGVELPKQRTGWSAVLHVLQRYGAWVAVERYSEIFDRSGGFHKNG